MCTNKWMLAWVIYMASLVCFAQDSRTDSFLIPAEDFVLNQFRDKDVILLGELHRIKEHADFVSAIIPVLHRNGIHLLFSEFADYDDLDRIDSLLTSPTFNQDLAHDIQWKNQWDWGYKEYVDIYYAAWKVNQTLSPGQNPFRIIGLENPAHPRFADPELTWAYVIDSIGIRHGKKALVYCGMHHAFTHYHQPYMVEGKVEGFVTSRVGNWLYKRNPNRVMTILLHGPWYGATMETYVLPCDGKIDSLFQSRAIRQENIGFLTNETVFNSFMLRGSFYGNGYEEGRIQDLCQGYIVVKPICDLNPVTPIPDFINASNITETIETSHLVGLSAKELNDIIQEWLIQQTKGLFDMRLKYCKEDNY